MANIYDYIDWRGDLSLNERPFNDIDNLILSEICYAQMEDIVPTDGNNQITIHDIHKGYLEHGYVSHVVNDPRVTLEKAAQSIRFKDILADNYVNTIDQSRQIQFAAVTFHLPDDTLYVSFRGTDNTIVGWREDFNFSFMETAGQEEAAAYLDRIAKENSKMIRVGGHSKGGNLAVYAAAFASQSTKDRILAVYSNDGPGFNDRISNSESYIAMLPKVRLIVPSFSLVGILLNNKSERTIVKSDGTGPMQHSPLTWQVRATEFETVDEQDPASLFLDETMSKWIASLDDEERRALVSSIFDSVDASGATTLQDFKVMKQKALFAIGKAVMKIDSTRKKELAVIMKKLASAGIEVAKEQGTKRKQTAIDKD